MLGRAAYQTPYLLAEVDGALFFDTRPQPTRHTVLERLLPYAERHIAQGGRLASITRHVLGLYHGRPYARAFRRYLSEHAVGARAGVDVLARAIAIAEGQTSLTAEGATL